MPKKSIICLITVLLLSGCVTMYVPIVWDHRERINEIIGKDPLLSALYRRYDPDRMTLRGPNGFDETRSLFETKAHLAAYKATTNIIYVNREVTFTDEQLREIIIHEFCHHIWSAKLDKAVKIKWETYLRQHSSAIPRLVGLYYPQSSQSVENFAFTVQYPQKEDIKELATLSILNDMEANAILDRMKAEPKYSFWGIGMFDVLVSKK